MKKKKIILLDNFNNTFFRLLKKKFKNIHFIKKINNYTNVNAILSFKRYSFESKIAKLNLKIFKNLKWIHIPFAGVENVEYLRKYSTIKFTSAKKIQSTQVADHAIALMLAITRNISFLAKYGLKAKFDILPTEIKNKKILVIGYGSIGKTIVKRLIGFEPEISILINKSRPKKTAFIKKIYERKELLLATKNKDIVFITIPSNNINRSIFTISHLKSMNKKSIVINVSREDIFEPKHLKKFIRKNKEFYLGMDYFSKKFIKENSYLLKEKNVILSPHIAGLSDNYGTRHQDLLQKNIKNFSLNKKLINKIF